MPSATRLLPIPLLAVSVSLIASVASAIDRSMELHPTLVDYVAARTAEFDLIPADRKATLQSLARYIADCKSAGDTARLTFICTHNSRRSHFAQIWASVATARYQIVGVDTFSGGTESTAFNPRAVAALQRAGFHLEKVEPTASASGTGPAVTTASQNPHYGITFASHCSPLVCYSKTFDAESNPTSDFCAVMTCSDADKRCPHIAGATLRISLPYEDPKLADGTPLEAATYDERCAQIAREMLYVLSLVK